MKKSRTSIAKKMILWIVGSSIGIASIISAAYLYNDYQEKLKAVQKQHEDIHFDMQQEIENWRTHQK